MKKLILLFIPPILLNLYRNMKKTFFKKKLFENPKKQDLELYYDKEMAKILDRKYPTKEDSIKVVDSPVLIPTFRKEDYWGVEGFGDVIESNLSWHKEVMRKKVGHLFCHMTGVWKYSDNGIDWTPIREEFAEEFKEVA